MDKISSLREVLDSNEAALIFSPSNRYYFTDFPSSAGCILITCENAYFLIDSRYYESAKKIVKSLDVVNTDRTINKKIKELLDVERIEKIYIENSYVTIKDLKQLEIDLQCEFIKDNTLSDKISYMRMIKTDDEISRIIEAQKISEKAFLEILNMIRPGVSEIDVSIQLEFLMKKYGASKVSFDLITITGAKTSVPHGSPDESVVKEGDLFTLDIGCVYHGYCSDMTRTIAVKSITDKQREIYQIVLEAHKEAKNVIKAGNKVSSVDIAAREYITEKGYGKYFTHTTGHGLGIDIHEAPVVYEKTDMILQKNMVITDEPGIYIPDEFGVRIEDMYLVDNDSCIDLATVSKDLIIL